MHIADPRQVPAGVFVYTPRPARLEMPTEGPTVVVFAGRTLTRDADRVAAVAICAPSAGAATVPPAA